MAQRPRLQLPPEGMENGAGDALEKRRADEMRSKAGVGGGEGKKRRRTRWGSCCCSAVRCESSTLCEKQMLAASGGRGGDGTECGCGKVEWMTQEEKEWGREKNVPEVMKNDWSACLLLGVLSAAACFAAGRRRHRPSSPAAWRTHGEAQPPFHLRPIQILRDGEKSCAA